MLERDYLRQIEKKPQNQKTEEPLSPPLVPVQKGPTLILPVTIL